MFSHLEPPLFPAQGLVFLLLPLTVVVLRVGAVVLLPLWEWLLDRDWGRHWPVGAAILPACIPIARSFEENAPALIRSATVAALLLAVAVVQLYGQERNNRDRIETARERIETENRFSDLLNEVRQGRRESRIATDSLRITVSEQGSQVRRIADGITALAAQAEEEIKNGDD